MTGDRIGRWLERHRPLAMLIVIVVCMSWFAPRFLTPGNLENLTVQFAAAGVIAIGMTVVLIGGGFDLSVGATMALTGVASVKLLQYGLAPALVGALAVGALVGVGNGLLVTRARINPFIATLATMIIVRGAALWLADGRPTFADYPTYAELGNGQLLTLPNSGVVLLGTIVAVGLLLRYTTLGRNVYAVGGNEEAAHVAGVNVARVRTWTYVISGTTAALAGILVSARLSVASPTVGEDAALAGITAAILGGTSLYGGVGGIAGTCQGLLIVAVLANGLDLMEVPTFYQSATAGLVLIVAVVLESVTRGKGRRSVRLSAERWRRLIPAREGR